MSNTPMSFACWQGLSPEQKRYATYLAFRGLGEKLRPKVVSCTINAAGDTLTLGFSKPVVAGSDGFNDGLTLNTDGVAVAATYASGSGTNTLVYALDAIVNAADTLTLDYTQPGY